MRKKGRVWLAMLLAGVALLVVVNAAVFTYRWMEGQVTVVDSSRASGAACTGFYSSSEQPGINLPNAGSNYNAPIYGSNNIVITTGNPTCSWTDNGNTYYLYESITVDLDLTVGSWYLKDIYGFGYNGAQTDPPVYLYLKVEQPVDPNIAPTAKLIIYYTNGTQATILDLTSTGQTQTPIKLNPGDGLQLDLRITAANTGDTSFKVGFYVTQTSGEPPR